ncbi:phage head completion protein [Polymorphobacter sp.]|uniref:phage head completion protein n=1 Tax=Polymorphobacter sp. TaxID=1909290 RepID=UPI003F72778B
MTDGRELAGRLRERVTIEEWVEARDAAGLDAGHWAVRATAPAAVEAERLTAADARPGGEALRPAARLRVTLRAPGAGGFAVGLTSRLWWRGERLTVLAVERDPLRGETLVLRCRSAG